MINQIKKIDEDYLNAIMAYIEEFSSKQEMEFDGWTIVGDIANFGDFWISFSDIRLDIISGAKKGRPVNCRASPSVRVSPSRSKP